MTHDIVHFTFGQNKFKCQSSSVLHSESEITSSGRTKSGAAK